jgi:hypothetical protein
MLDTPLVNDHVEVGFRTVTGAAGEFELLESDQVTGAWTTNETAMLITNVPNIAYHFAAPLNGPVRFYKVQSNN